ncbi:hypothetical protein KUM39_00385 [Streptomyces sp. J2-1]|uniref:DUF6397 family protein n=1 Tax=Streptomyces corallincola TaxID=2851888 RepID=UPI001C391A7E|nr:DUF6397 family protein [Streptomyces corallincola]MBV2352825.1 hypothetical protein [Streptomyces corallincola]
MQQTTIDVPAHPGTLTPAHAARELGLKREEFDLAVHLGGIRVLPDAGGGGGRRVEQAELDRLRGEPGFPSTLRERVRIVGTAEGAALMGISPGRFTRLARLGFLIPVRFYRNRYRAVVWLYLAHELAQFAARADSGPALTGRTPETLRGQLEAGVDLRARNWRGRHLGLLLRQAPDAWARAGVVAGFLAAVEVADIVPDPYERSYVNRLRVAPPGHAAPGSPSAHLAESLTTAQDPDEIGWLRGELAAEVELARTEKPAPRPDASTGARTGGRRARTAVEQPPPPRGPSGEHPHPAPTRIPRSADSGGSRVTRPGLPRRDYGDRLAVPRRRATPRAQQPDSGAGLPPRGLRAWLRRRSCRATGPGARSEQATRSGR